MSTDFHAAAAGRDPNSFVLRRLLPLTVVTTVAAGVLRWLATRHGVLSEVEGVIAMTGVAVAVCIGYSLWAAGALERATLTRRDADRMNLYRLVANNLPGGAVFVFDRELRYVLAQGNNFAAARLRSEELEGRTIWEALEPDVAADLEPMYRLALAGETHTYEMDFHDNAYLVTIAPTYDDGGRIIGGLAQAQEITDQRRLEEQLRQSQKLEAIGQLAGGVAHDFNNLLTVISGYASMMRVRGHLDGADQETLEQIALAAERAASLTQQLLAFSRRQVLRPARLDVNEAVEALLPMLRALVEERIDIIVHTEPGLPHVLFDRGRLEQALVNLVVNARDAIDDAGRIVIETSSKDLTEEYAAAHVDAPAGRQVVVSVSDTGAGMDVDTQARIFEPFFTTKPVGEGTGLGLSTVHGIVKQSGGLINVYSEPGFGSVFRIYIPVPAEAGIELERVAPEPWAIPSGGTVLLVEDHEAVRQLTERILDRAGYTVLAAAGTAEALELLAAEEVDLVLSDLVMPGGTGERISGIVDSRGFTPPVVFMSGYTEASISREDLAHVAAGFVEKPFTPGQLVDEVEAALSADAKRASPPPSSP